MFWSHALAQAYLCEISDSALIATWSASDTESETVKLRPQLAEWSFQDELVRAWIVEAWRSGKVELIKATERLSAEEISVQPNSWFEDLCPNQVLLAILSEAAEDTAEDVTQLISLLPKGRLRSTFHTYWSALQAPRIASSLEQIALVGGHSSESPRIRALENDLGIRFKWIAVEKSKGLNPSHSALAALESVEAIIVVTGNVGHSTMHCARKAAARIGVPCWYVKSITARNLGQCLETMRSNSNC